MFLTSFLVLALTESVEGFWYQYLGKYYLGCASWSYAAFAQWSTAWAAPVSCLSCWLLLGEPRRMEEPARWLEKGCIPFPPVCSQSPLRPGAQHTGGMEQSSLASKGPVVRVRLLREIPTFVPDLSKLEVILCK